MYVQREKVNDTQHGEQCILSVHDNCVKSTLVKNVMPSTLNILVTLYPTNYIPTLLILPGTLFRQELGSTFTPVYGGHSRDRVKLSAI